MNTHSENIEVILHTLLYVLKKLGGSADFHKVFKILYFADQKHLVRYGSPICDDTYISMTNGPVPSITYDILKSLRGQGLLNTQKDQFEPYFQLTTNSFSVKAKVDPDMDFLSETEVSCIDESVAENATLSFHELTEKSHDSAWEKGRESGEMNMLDVAVAGGAQPDMLDYIEDTLENQKAQFG
ncbi:MAG: hypothetical protein C1941_05090 [Prosthecochloris sp.]|nr:hypothetical protein [Prosthecochloris sp.]